MNIVFVCHGNICRSPVAEIILSDLIKEAHLDNEIKVISRATSLEEIGNDIYPPMKRVLSNHGYYDVHHYAQRMSKSEFDNVIAKGIKQAKDGKTQSLDEAFDEIDRSIS